MFNISLKTYTLMNRCLIISLLVLVMASCKKDPPFTLEENHSFAKESLEVIKKYNIGSFQVTQTIYGPGSMPSLQDTTLFTNFFIRITEDSLFWKKNDTTHVYAMTWKYDVEKQTQIYYKMNLAGVAGGTSAEADFDLRPLEVKNGYLILYNSWYSGTWYYLKRLN